ncbi:phage tail spike protein [Geobacillus thermodenitrificans]|uniref:phage tail protein n=1 Tax=Geobacillus thermodenitrificans TaxID=33940 RepID=UPI002E2029A1|nr:phage tail spike protein [Geobacillus thermodenitrificans]MED3716027.1 phage tail spike protein [Geobacillus thermodenitrificans]
MLIVTSLQGQTEALTDYKELTRKQRVNGERSLSFVLFKTERNAHAFDLVKEESIIEYDDHKYRIKQLEELAVGAVPMKRVRADHVFFDVIDVYQYGTISGTKTISEALSFALNGTGWTFVVVGSFSTVQFENFGDDNAAALFQKILESYGAEFDIVGNEVRIYNQIGANTDFQFRYRHNIKTLEKIVKTDNLSTYIKGYGKRNDDGTYATTAEYTSPMASIFGIRHAKPIYDERFTNSNSLLEYIKTQIQDTPEISITIDFVDLAKAGYPLPRPRLGDTVYLIYEPLGIDITTRIMEITDYPESDRSPEVTLANFKESFTDVSIRYTKSQIEKIYNEQTGRIRYTALDEAVRQATEALQSAQTELKFENGIIAIDKNDPNNIVLFNSAGIGISDDGGQTFKTAMTGSGIVADVITSGALNTNNIVVGNNKIRMDNNGLYVYKNGIMGASLVEGNLTFFDQTNGQKIGMFAATVWSDGVTKGISMNMEHDRYISFGHYLNPTVGYTPMLILNPGTAMDGVPQGIVANLPFRANADMWLGTNALRFGLTNTHNHSALWHDANNNLAIASYTGIRLAYLTSGGVANDRLTVDANSVDVWQDLDLHGWKLLRVAEADFMSTARIAHDNDAVYIQHNGEVRATQYKSATYVPVRASSFPTGSLAEFKEEIRPWEESALEKIRQATIYEYYLKSELERGIYRKRQGLVVGEGYNTPAGVIDGDGVEQYLMNSWSWKAIQELDSEQQSLKDRIAWLELENQYLKQKVSQLETRIAELETKIV